MLIIGREHENAVLQRLCESDESEFVAIYGRRRIGKTYLVNETFGYKFAFHHAGLKRDSLKEQLEHFRLSLMRQGYWNCPKIKSWLEAFYHLEVYLEHLPDGKKVVFLDEMPWMDTFKSGFLVALEAFWNSWATSRKDVLLVACGSATTWIINKILRNKAGLHNRVTRKIKLLPFTLRECELYAKEKHLGYDRRQIAECYMVLGGVAYYWSLWEKGKSPSQNINALFWSEQGGLIEEFRELYDSLFRHSEPYIDIVNVLGRCRNGMTREDLRKELKIGSSGNLSTYLTNLEEYGFIRKYHNIMKSTKECTYQLMDNYTIFYFQFLKGKHAQAGDYWSDGITNAAKNAWRGLAFERLCLDHISQIKKALGISGMLSDVYFWRYAPKAPDETGVQIDLLIDRKDGIINVCEMKYAPGEYAIDKEEMSRLQNRLEVFRLHAKSRKSLHLTMVTTFGLKHNGYWNEVQSEVNMNDLFDN